MNALCSVFETDATGQTIFSTRLQLSADDKGKVPLRPSTVA